MAREAANEVIRHLKQLRLNVVGSIAVGQIDLSLSEAAARAEEEAPGEGDDAVVWEELARRVSQEDAGSPGPYLAFLAIATQIAAIGVLVDSTILIVGDVGGRRGPPPSASDCSTA